MEWYSIDQCFQFIRNGKNIKQYGNEGYPITRIETISDRIVDESKVGYAAIYNIEQYEDYILKKGDILMSHINSEKHLGKVAMFDSDNTLIHGMNLLCLRAKGDIISPKYALYCFNSTVFLKQIPRITKNSVNQSSFNITSLKKLQIPVPPIEIQEQIVEVLDKAQNLIYRRKEQISLLDDLIESIFYEMFGDPVKNEKGWEIDHLKNVIKIKSAKIDEKDIVNKAEVWLLNLDVIQSNNGKILEKKYVDVTNLPASKISFDERYVLYSKLRPYLNKVVIPNSKGFATSELVPLLPTERITKIFLSYLLRSKSVVEYLNTHTSGAKMPRVVMKDFREMLIPVPPLPLQNQFAEKVEAIEKQKATLTESLELMEDNYNSIMQRAFKGELFR